MKPIVGVQLFGPLVSLSEPDRKNAISSHPYLYGKKKLYIYIWIITIIKKDKASNTSTSQKLDRIYRTLKVGNGDGVSILGLLNTGSLALFFTTETESWTSSVIGWNSHI